MNKKFSGAKARTENVSSARSNPSRTAARAASREMLDVAFPTNAVKAQRRRFSSAIISAERDRKHTAVSGLRVASSSARSSAPWGGLEWGLAGDDASGSPPRAPR